jgi:hypothetical protein
VRHRPAWYNLRTPATQEGRTMNGMTISTTTRTLLDLVERAVVTPLAS